MTRRWKHHEVTHPSFFKEQKPLLGAFNFISNLRSVPFRVLGGKGFSTDKTGDSPFLYVDSGSKSIQKRSLSTP